MAADSRGQKGEEEWQVRLCKVDEGEAARWKQAGRRMMLRHEGKTGLGTATYTRGDNTLKQEHKDRSET